jgi:hypothetical protein
MPGHDECMEDWRKQKPAAASAGREKIQNYDAGLLQVIWWTSKAQFR